MTLTNFTFDTNCLVDLELNEGAAAKLQEIVSAHDSGKCFISIPGIGASERLPNGTFADNFAVFQQRIRRLSRIEFEILRPLMYFDISYLDWSILAGDDLLALEERIHNVLFPETKYRWADEAACLGLDPDDAGHSLHPSYLKWRNRKCDTLALWCHAYYNKDVFVTRDKNFHKASKKLALEAIVSGRIMRPSDVVL
jgi:hypothetical protein